MNTDAYSIDVLKRKFKEFSKASEEYIDQKKHCTYFDNYFSASALSAKTIVTESQYIDKDYLEDYSVFYLRCFHSYEKICNRLHFFNIQFTREEFENFLKGDRSKLNEDNLQEAYLGFIVVKPLPETFIGKTCLKTYPEAIGRIFPTQREYSVNIFGLELKIKGLAYQEQDRVTSACATSALWSTFHKTGHCYQHLIPSPAQITKYAHLNLPHDNRTFPNKDGLTITEMCQAIRFVGLESNPFELSDDASLKNIVFAYVTGGLPVLLIIKFYDSFHDNYDYHAVAVTGYNIGSSPATSELKLNNMLLTSSKIDKIYVHDDQIGPYSRMIFDDQKFVRPGTTANLSSLSCDWGKRAILEMVIVPEYHKIRITYMHVLQLLSTLDNIFEQFRIFNTALFPERLVWSLHLTTVNDYKKDSLGAQNLSGDYKLDVLLTRMPKYIWLASAYSSNDEKCLEIVFDATDIEQGEIVVRVVKFNVVVSAFFEQLATKDLEKFKYDMGIYSILKQFI
jgi:hypothetical protein